MRKIIKSKSKKLAKANYGMAITGDKNKTFVGTGTQARWTEDSVKKSKSKYPQFSKEIDEAFTNQTKRDQAKADAEIARANAAKKKAAATPTVTQKYGGGMYKKGGAANKAKMIYKKKK